MSFIVFASSRPQMLRDAAPSFDTTAPTANGQVPPPSPAGPLASAPAPSVTATATPPFSGGGVDAPQTPPQPGDLPNIAPNATAVDQQQAVPGAPAAALKGVPAPDADQFIYQSEARTDAQGNPRVYQLPPGDTGGTQEVAGFTDKYDPQELATIMATPPAQRKQVVLQMIDKRIAPAQGWAADPSVQGLLGDTIFHRGVNGAQAIVHTALTGQVPTDPTGKPITNYSLTPDEIQQLQVMHPLDAINAISQARQTYENAVYGQRPGLAKGLQNRFNNAQRHFTQLYLGES